MSIFSFLVENLDLPFIIRPDLWERFQSNPADDAYMSALVVAGVFQYDPKKYALRIKQAYSNPIDALLRVCDGRLRLCDEMWQNFHLNPYSQHLFGINLAGYNTQSLQTFIKCTKTGPGLGNVSLIVSSEHIDRFMEAFEGLNIFGELCIAKTPTADGWVVYINNTRKIAFPLISPIAILHRIAVNNPITFERDVTPELKEIIMHELLEGQKKLRSMSREEKLAVVNQYTEELISSH